MLAQEKIPPSWEIVRAGDVIDVRDGTHDSPKPVDIGIPLVTSKNLVGGRIDFDSCSFISEADHKKISQRSAVDDGDILYAMIGTIGNPVLVEKTREFSIKNVALFKFSGRRVYNRFFLHFLQSDNVKRQFQRKARGGTQKFVSLGNIRGLEIPLPPLPEQRRIAAILDKADALRQKRRQAIEKLDQLLQSVFLDMFGDPVTNPKGWDVKPVEEIVRDFVGGKNVQSAEVGDPFTHRILKVSAVTKKIYDASESKPLPIDSKIDPRAYVGRGDLLISRANTAELVGATAYVWDTPANIVLPDKVWKFDFRTEAPPLFIWEIFKNEAFRSELSKLGSGTSGSMKNISKQKLRKVLLIQPPMNLQKEFAEVSEKLHSMITSANVAKLKQDRLFHSLQQRAFNGTL